MTKTENALRLFFETISENINSIVRYDVSSINNAIVPWVGIEEDAEIRNSYVYIYWVTIIIVRFFSSYNTPITF